VSDAGESWSELVMAGYTNPRPTSPEQAALKRLCAQHGLTWASERTEVFGIAHAGDFPDVARRVTAVALAIDGWRAWYPDLVHDPPLRATAIVRGLVDLGPKTHWNVEPQAR
jgi:hypothetical protein